MLLDGHSEASADAPPPPNGESQETTQPGGNRGYVVLCLPETPDGVPEEKRRRRELNPRPESTQTILQQALAKISRPHALQMRCITATLIV